MRHPRTLPLPLPVPCPHRAESRCDGSRTPEKSLPIGTGSPPDFGHLAGSAPTIKAVCTRLLDQLNAPTPDSPTRGHVTP
jgi:hypothetical protein